MIFFNKCSDKNQIFVLPEEIQGKIDASEYKNSFEFCGMKSKKNVYRKPSIIIGCLIAILSFVTLLLVGCNASYKIKQMSLLNLLSINAMNQFFYFFVVFIFFLSVAGFNIFGVIYLGFWVFVLMLLFIFSYLLEKETFFLFCINFCFFYNPLFWFWVFKLENIRKFFIIAIFAPVILAFFITLLLKNIAKIKEFFNEEIVEKNEEIENEEILEKDN
jgi:hypothetical protein